MLLILLIIIDQFMKQFALIYLSSGITYQIFSDKIMLILARNYGLSYGIFANFFVLNSRLILLIIIEFIFMLCVICVSVMKQWSTQVWNIGLKLFIAGGISNIVDRVLYGCVIDMIAVESFYFIWFILLIVSCIILTLLHISLNKKITLITVLALLIGSINFAMIRFMPLSTHYIIFNLADILISIAFLYILYNHIIIPLCNNTNTHSKNKLKPVNIREIIK